MKVRNVANGGLHDIPDDVWSVVKDEKHVKGILVPVQKAKVPEEVVALQEEKDKKTKADKTAEKA